MQAENKLQRQFGLRTAIALIVGQVIAVGIFLTPAGMAKSLGSPFLLLCVWLVMGAMALCGALCYGELASRYPEAGGSYVYLREAYGAPVAFLYGWMVLLVLDPGLTAALSVGMTKYVNYFIPLSSFGQKLIAVGTIFIIAFANILGARIGANILQTLTVLKLSTLFFIIIWGFGGGFGEWSNFTPFAAQREGSEPLIGAIAGGIVGAFFAFAGWWDVSKVSGEVENAERNLPRALTIGVLVITLIYVLTSAVFFYLVPLNKVTDSETFAAQAGEVLFGAIGGKVFAAIVIVSVLGTLMAYVMSAPRVYYAMAKDGLFFSAIARLHTRFKTPHRATLIQVSLASLLILTGTFEQIISYFFFITVLFIAMTVAGLFILRKRNENFAGYQTIFYPATPIIFLFLTAIVLLLIALRNPLQTFLGVFVVLLGLPVYALFFSKRGANQIVEGESYGLD